MQQPVALVRAKRPVRGVAVVVLDTYRQDRGLRLDTFNSRALLKHEVHEIILTDEEGAVPGAAVDRIAYLCFLEITQGGVVHVGDRLLFRGKPVGRLAGFDLTHFPNHLNIVVKTDDLRSGADAGLLAEEAMEFAWP
ncbi:MAG: hypothetical protein M1531_11280 [Chloroflexi bacterium]|nr:hypothetical protein [Chloroflexota bacterium]